MPKPTLAQLEATIARAAATPKPPKVVRRGDSVKLRRLIAGAGLTKRQAAKVLEISERMMRYYAAGDVHVPKTVMLAAEHLFVCQTK